MAGIWWGMAGFALGAVFGIVLMVALQAADAADAEHFGDGAQ